MTKVSAAELTLVDLCNAIAVSLRRMSDSDRVFLVHTARSHACYLHYVAVDQYNPLAERENAVGGSCSVGSHFDGTMR